MVLEGAMNGEWFRAYVARVRVPELRPGDVVVMDPLGSHTGAAVRSAIAGAGCHLLFRPPDSPDLNPIANAFPKLKGLWRTVDGLGSAIERLLDPFPPEECRNDLRHCGYPATPR